LIVPQQWIKEIETLLSDSKLLTLPGGFEPFFELFLKLLADIILTLHQAFDERSYVKAIYAIK
jgi:hypothetical protein